MKLKIHFSNGKKGDESSGFDINIDSDLKDCLAALDQAKSAIEEIAKGDS